jgi:hypothetical protein
VTQGPFLGCVLTGVYILFHLLNIVFIASLQSPFVLYDSRAHPRICFITQGYKAWKFYNPETKKVIISERADFDEQFFMNKRHSSPQLPPPPPDSLVEPSPPIVQLPDAFNNALDDSDLSQQPVHGGNGSVTSELPPAHPESPPLPSVFHTAPTSSSPPASTPPKPAPMVEPAPSHPQHQRQPKEKWLTE